MDEINNFLDEWGRLTAYPSKRKLKLYALIYLAEQIEADKTYTEKGMNELLKKWHTFDDPATLRRELYTHRFINRDSYGKEYKKEERQPTIDELIKRYG